MQRGKRFFQIISILFAMGFFAACTFEAGTPIADDNSGWQVGEGDDVDNGDARDDDGAVAPPGDVGGPSADVGGPEDTGAPGDEDTGPDDATDTTPNEADDAGEDTGPTTVLCDGWQTDLMTSADHCGACDNACDGSRGVCENGQCGCEEPGWLACGEGNACLDTNRDPLHCGDCGNACGAGERCVDGQCECRPGFTLCGGECVDTDRNPLHCGGCDQNCGYGRCDNGSCGSGDCGWQFGCEQGDGLACFGITEVNSALYCAPSLQNTCGNVCDGNQICARAGTLTLRCRDVRPGLGCTGCPCDDCTDDERCVEDPDGMNGVFCLER